jgi:transposase InsO family protein
MFIQDHKEEFPILRMCQVLEVSESGYYAWFKREPSERERGDKERGEQIEDAYQKNRHVYGSPRLHAELREQGIHCGKKRVVRFMRERGINAKPKRRKMKTTDSRHDNPGAPNVLDRNFSADAPTTKWVSDITGIETGEGWLSLAAIVDIYSRFVVGWSMKKERDEELIPNAALMALVRRHPGSGLLHHGDSGKPIHQ